MTPQRIKPQDDEEKRLRLDWERLADLCLIAQDTLMHPRHSILLKEQLEQQRITHLAHADSQRAFEAWRAYRKARRDAEELGFAG